MSIDLRVGQTVQLELLAEESVVTATVRHKGAEPLGEGYSFQIGSDRRLWVYIKDMTATEDPDYIVVAN
jgi:hypothetical protein